jgi:hypothetical protein
VPVRVQVNAGKQKRVSQRRAGHDAAPETSDDVPMPRRPSSSWTNFAGGVISPYVQIGQLRS